MDYEFFIMKVSERVGRLAWLGRDLNPSAGMMKI